MIQRFALSHSMILIVFACALDAVGRADDHPLPLEQRTRLRERWKADIQRHSAFIKSNPKQTTGYSRRGDAYFFNGDFKKAVEDYDAMVELKSGLATSHWRRGIALFYAAKYKRAANQFEIYHSFDDVDRENGIWRFFSQRKAYGVKRARAGLLKYKKDDREPFPAVYQLFADEIKPAQILKEIRSAEISKTERQKRLFYAELYIGLNYAVADQPKSAVGHLRRAVANTWGPRGGFGPNYMWHVGRLHYELLSRKKDKPPGDDPDQGKRIERPEPTK